jgi:hypothetical protein
MINFNEGFTKIFACKKICKSDPTLINALIFMSQ